MYHRLLQKTLTLRMEPMSLHSVFSERYGTRQCIGGWLDNLNDDKRYEGNSPAGMADNVLPGEASPLPRAGLHLGS